MARLIRYERVTRLSSACFRTASTCSRLTPGNHSRNSSIVAPPSMFSNSARTGTRVPLNSHAPLTFSGLRSTSGQSCQSSMALYYVSLGRINRRYSPAFRAAVGRGAEIVAADRTFPLVRFRSCHEPRHEKSDKQRHQKWSEIKAPPDQQRRMRVRFLRLLHGLFDQPWKHSYRRGKPCGDANWHPIVL